jgi:muconolactone D-isomerase
VEFLVRIYTRWPAEGDPATFERLTVDERRRAAELVAAGTIRRLWRIPGQRANAGIWEAPTTEDLHLAITSLPFYPWLEVEVVALALHPSDPGWPSTSM